ncbi:hypothetical protein J6590_039809 [Homalodisca vitripennis]|nr:hypothetical protein J6590_039809 [Homalodisca vitripennis]
MEMMTKFLLKKNSILFLKIASMDRQAILQRFAFPISSPHPRRRIPIVSAESMVNSHWSKHDVAIYGSNFRAAQSNNATFTNSVQLELQVIISVIKRMWATVDYFVNNEYFQIGTEAEETGSCHARRGLRPTRLLPVSIPDADLNERSDECCFESVSVVLYGDSFFYHQTRSKEVVLVLLGK